MSERFEWLDEHTDEIIDRYESGQSLREIANVFDVSPPTIQRRLHEHDTEMRNGGPRYIQLEDCVGELVKQYVEHDDDIQTIADRYKTSVTAIQHYLENADIPCAPPSPQRTDVRYTPAQISIIQGELLGDGCLHRQEPGNCFFQLSTTTRAHAERLIQMLPDRLFPDAQPNVYTRSNALGEEAYTSWTISSRPQPAFERMYESWYEERTGNNSKTVPENFTLNRTAFLHWYWGDGNCSIRDRGAPRVSFATHGFTESGVALLQSEVDRLGYDNYTVTQEGVDNGSGQYIRLRDYDARKFLEDFRRVNHLPQYDYKFPVPEPDT
ncbi:endonuclease I-EndH [Haloarcula japonica]|uniref:Endonuclease I-EndH n=1 Tax=Haloarcula japonica (strain ATCC 49778 / DSM 6131 / JCM 7785 / NBRC 101032 / NCIMB 13157 / TR-1) TaxID=1227453 RepID=M0LDG6_HALJT|nr:endonuclease I-EndH [Haloarcula japonica]EMA30479.1 putative endonuclease I-EndH [Haloarcula japonica DSM 6131]